MENTVTMSLEAYTKIISENIKLKETLQCLRKKAEDEVDELIKDSRICNLTKESCVNYLDQPKETLISEFSNAYSWTCDNIARSCYIVDKNEVKQLLVDSIIVRIKDRLDELKSIEQQKQENKQE